MTREAKKMEQRLRDNMEQFRSQQEQNLGNLDTRTDVMIETRTQAILDRQDGLLNTRNGSEKQREALERHE